MDDLAAILIFASMVLGVAWVVFLIKRDRRAKLAGWSAIACFVLSIAVWGVYSEYIETPEHKQARQEKIAQSEAQNRARKAEIAKKREQKRQQRQAKEQELAREREQLRAQKEAKKQQAQLEAQEKRAAEEQARVKTELEKKAQEEEARRAKQIRQCIYCELRDDQGLAWAIAYSQPGSLFNPRNLSIWDEWLDKTMKRTEQRYGISRDQSEAILSEGKKERWDCEKTKQQKEVADQQKEALGDQVIQSIPLPSRRQIYYELSYADGQAVIAAGDQVANMFDPKWHDIFDAVSDRNRRAVEQRYRINRAQSEAIIRQGVTENWPEPSIDSY